VVDQSSILPTSYDVSEIIDMIDKKDTRENIKNKLKMLSDEISKSIILHKRKFSNKLTDSRTGLPNTMGVLLKHMREDFDTVNSDMLSINDKKKFQVGDFRMWNALWVKYKKIKETYETN
tara:strand:- start:714 stop:1073 length:360 start_codon:yes stop_codon:yes gene_type:complete